jgi:hypothetical protein
LVNATASARTPPFSLILWVDGIQRGEFIAESQPTSDLSIYCEGTWSLPEDPTHPQQTEVIGGLVVWQEEQQAFRPSIADDQIDERLVIHRLAAPTLVIDEVRCWGPNDCW